MTNILHAVFKDGSINSSFGLGDGNSFNLHSVGKDGFLSLNLDALNGGNFSADIDSTSVLITDETEGGDFSDESEENEDEDVAALVFEGSDHTSDGCDKTQDTEVMEFARSGIEVFVVIVVVVEASTEAMMITVMTVMTLVLTREKGLGFRSLLLRSDEFVRLLFIFCLMNFLVVVVVVHHHHLMIHVVSTLLLMEAFSEFECLRLLLVEAAIMLMVVVTHVHRDDQNKSRVDKEKSGSKESTLAPFVNTKLSFGESWHIFLVEGENIFFVCLW